MPLVPCKCTNCGANLQVDNTKDAAVCEFCGSAFIVEKAINNYNITNNISAGVVNVFGGNSDDFVIRGGRLEKYNGTATEVLIPNSVKSIGGSAFSGLMVTSVIIPEGVVRIEGSDHPGAFCNCTALENVVIPSSMTEIGRNAFCGCKKLTEIIIPEGVVRIERGAFSRCSSLKSLTFPQTLTEIGAFAFNDCSSLSQIIIPKNVQKIGYCAFDSCTSLEYLKIEGMPETDTLSTSGSDDDDKYYGAFSNCPNLSKVEASDEWLEKYGTRSIEYLMREYWRKKYEESREKVKKSGPCYIATSVYGSYDCPPVWTLRRFRDHTLDSTWYGRAFIKTYYAISPTLVKWFGHTKWFQMFWRGRLDKLVSRLNAHGMDDTPYQDKHYR